MQNETDLWIHSLNLAVSWPRSQHLEYFTVTSQQPICSFLLTKIYPSTPFWFTKDQDVSSYSIWVYKRLRYQSEPSVTIHVINILCSLSVASWAWQTQRLSNVRYVHLHHMHNSTTSEVAAKARVNEWWSWEIYADDSLEQTEPQSRPFLPHAKNNNSCWCFLTRDRFCTTYGYLTRM